MPALHRLRVASFGGARPRGRLFLTLSYSTQWPQGFNVGTSSFSNSAIGIFGRPLAFDANTLHCSDHLCSISNENTTPMDISSEALLLLILITFVIEVFVILWRTGSDATNELGSLTDSMNLSLNRMDTLLREQFTTSRAEQARSSKDAQELVHRQLSLFGQTQSALLTNFQNQLTDLTKANQHGFNEFRHSIAKALHEIRSEINNRLVSIQKDNSVQLEKMRATVDEKLQKTLEDRLGKSFELVSKHLAEVQKGLGEMQHLATGVGDLKKVLSNVKTRGVMGEIQLGNILEQLLTQEQYGVNVATIPGSRCHVEFAIKLPGRDKSNTSIWLPIDSKFPMDRYERLQDAYESGEAMDIERTSKELCTTIKLMAKDINEKYIAPPHTTDFGILFLPTEGLYADVVRNSELIHQLQRDHKIIVAGPTNLAALLNSLQMGFRSLAIEKRSSEVWQVLGAVKTEFGKFGTVLDQVQSKLQQASNTIDKVGVRSRAIERNLREVEALPDVDKREALGLVEELS